MKFLLKTRLVVVVGCGARCVYAAAGSLSVGSFSSTRRKRCRRARRTQPPLLGLAGIRTWIFFRTSAERSICWRRARCSRPAPAWAARLWRLPAARSCGRGTVRVAAHRTAQALSIRRSHAPDQTVVPLVCSTCSATCRSSGSVRLPLRACGWTVAPSGTRQFASPISDNSVRDPACLFFCSPPSIGVPCFRPASCTGRNDPVATCRKRGPVPRSRSENVPKYYFISNSKGGESLRR